MKMRLSGAGGQGIILLGVVLAETALDKGYNALQSQSYGPEARGGASKCEVIISEDEILYPKIDHPDLVLALTQDSNDKYASKLEEDTILIVDEGVEVSEDVGTKHIYKLPIIKTATGEFKKPIVANIIAMGAIAKITKIFDYDTLAKRVLNKVPVATKELNENALRRGMEIVNEC